MSDTKTLIKYVRDRLNDGPNITFGKSTVCDLVEALEASEHRADKLKSDIDAGAKDYITLMDRHDAQFVRAEKAELDKAALEEDLKATEKNLKEASGFIEELLSGLKHRFPVQYADLEGDEYGDDAFSSHDLFELVIDPAVNAALEANCTHVKGPYWIYEGETDCLEADGVEFEVVGEGAVGSLGGISQAELVSVCLNDLGVDLNAGEEPCQK